MSHAPRTTRSRPARAYPASGHTLIEIVFSVAIVTVLMSAMVASIAIASRSLDDGTSPTGRVRNAAAVLDEINAEMSLAVSFSERSADAVTFTVPDRDGDQADETIRYAWTGGPDYRLTRQYNGGAAAVVAEDVRHFALTYGLKTVAP